MVRYTFIPIILCILFLSQGASADVPVGPDIPDGWGSTYTIDEINAIDNALWAANMTREDLNFRKDFTDGLECFPIVREMLAEPMEIAPSMDGIIYGFQNNSDELLSPWDELRTALEYYPEVEPFVIADFSPHDVLTTLLPLWQGPFSGDEYELLRNYIPETMSWHQVFESPYTPEQVAEWDKILEESAPDSLYTLMSAVSIKELALKYRDACSDPRFWSDEYLSELTSEPYDVMTDVGRLAVGTMADEVYEGDYAFLYDPGGNDHYINCRIGAAYGTRGRNVGFFADLGGDDVYDCGDVDITLGAAVMGVAAFYDLGQGNDRYIGGNCSLGAAMCGIATFYDDGGSDTYESKVFSQGAAGFGIGIMVDDSVQPAPDVPTDEETPDPIDIGAFDNDRYYAWANSQAFARTKGVAICSNTRGNEIYEAGGVYLHAPLFADRYQSFSQGFAIGERDLDYAGGIAMIVDYDGNDRYLGDVYNQGVGYWYSAGLLYDGGGNDSYEMTQYGQGSGIHLAVGGLIDVSGNDTYVMHNGLGVGGSHDYAASVLHDRGGNDRYHGNTSCEGGSLTNSAVIFIDRSGDDTYSGRRDSGINFGRPERGFGSIGILVDLSGADDYLGIMENGMLWSQTYTGIGWDIAQPPEPEITADETIPEEITPEVEMPEIIGYEGELTQEVFDELWEIAIRWEVGDNVYIVPEARKKIIDFGSDVLPYISRNFTQTGSLERRAFNELLRGFLESDREGVIDVLRENVTSDEPDRREVAITVIPELQINELEGEVTALFDDPDPSMRRRAIYALGVTGSHFADDRLIENLRVLDDEALIKVSMEALFALDVYIYDEVRPLLDYPYTSVREFLIGKLAANYETYMAALDSELLRATGRNDFGYEYPALSVRALRSVLKAFQISNILPDPEAVDAIRDLMEHDDWGVRADAVLVAYHWRDLTQQELNSVDPAFGFELISIIEPLISEIPEILREETEPYVLFVMGN